MRVPGTGKAGAELFLTIVLGRNRPSRECGVCGTHDSHSVCICTSPVLHSTHRVSNGAKVAHSVTGLPNLDVPPTSQAENCKFEFLTNRGHLVCIHGCSDRPVTHNTSNGEAEPRPRSSCHLGEIVCDNRIAKRGWCGFGGGGGVLGWCPLRFSPAVRERLWNRDLSKHRRLPGAGHVIKVLRSRGTVLKLCILSNIGRGLPGVAQQSRNLAIQVLAPPSMSKSGFDTIGCGREDEPDRLALNL